MADVNDTALNYKRYDSHQDFISLVRAAQEKMRIAELTGDSEIDTPTIALPISEASRFRTFGATDFARLVRIKFRGAGLRRYHIFDGFGRCSGWALGRTLTI